MDKRKRLGAVLRFLGQSDSRTRGLALHSVTRDQAEGSDILIVDDTLYIAESDQTLRYFKHAVNVQRLGESGKKKHTENDVAGW